jgi:hypothetical protein
MSEIWKRWEGQVVDHKYQLRQFLGSTDHSAVFAADFRDPEPRKAVVKFVSADVPHTEQILADWKKAEQLAHPNLLRIYSVGRCTIEEMELLYAAMEPADENLAEILPHRALTSEEVREMLNTLVAVLVYLHGRNLTHGHIKPSNILAIGDQLKVSSDSIQPIDELREMRRERDVYDAPEIPSSAYTPAADIWSLGVTLVETFAQQPAVLPFEENADPVIPPSMREPFLEIARQALRRKPRTRWTSAQIAAHLNPATAAANVAPEKAAAATASTNPPAAAVPAAVGAPATTSPVTPPGPSSTAVAAVSPLNVPLSREPAVPLGKQSGPPGGAAARPPMPRPQVPRRAAKPAPRPAIVLPNYVVPVLAGLLILAGIIALPKILHRRSGSPASPPPATTSASTRAATVQTSPSTVGEEPSAKPAAHPKAALSDAAKPAAPASPPGASTLPYSSASTAATLRRTEAPPSPARKNVSATPGRGEVLDQVLPRPSAAALSTVQGTVRVVIKVHVDAAGNVSEVLLDNPGPSKYFADQSVKAAHGWVFNSPEVDGRSAPSEWSIRFEFTSSGVHAYPKQTKP